MATAILLAASQPLESAEQKISSQDGWVIPNKAKYMRESSIHKTCWILFQAQLVASSCCCGDALASQNFPTVPLESIDVPALILCVTYHSASGMSDALAPRVATEICALMLDCSSGGTWFICHKNPGSTSTGLLMTNWTVQHLL
ncbi:hypothetical protein ACRRTK_000329 [Alexandromys fortis]